MLDLLSFLLQQLFKNEISGYFLSNRCRRLCIFDGPGVCTHGSELTLENICNRYLFRGDPSLNDYCYHTPLTQTSCPATGLPITPRDVGRLIAFKLRDSPAAAAHKSSTDANDIDVEALLSQISFWSVFKEMKVSLENILRSFTQQQLREFIQFAYAEELEKDFPAKPKRY
jgi:hypothetical protein